MFGPIELLIDFDFCPGMVAPRIPPEISIKIYHIIISHFHGIVKRDGKFSLKNMQIV